MTAALEGVSGQEHAQAALYPRERTGTHFTGAGWAPGPVWTGGKSRLHRDSIPDRPTRIQSLYRPSYPALTLFKYVQVITTTYVSHSCVVCMSCVFPKLLSGTKTLTSLLLSPSAGGPSSLNLRTGRPPTGVMIPEAV